MRYTQHHNKRRTAQDRPIPGRIMVANAAGGFDFAVNDWTRLHRFLILGSEGGTYYVGEPILTRDNAQAVERCVAADGPRVLRELLAVSEGGRAPKNDPALFVLALCASAADEGTRREALALLPRIARIGTHLFTFVTYLKDLRGRGKLAHRALQRWYTERELAELELQLAKYQGRAQAGERWTHRDVLRLARPRVEGDRNQALAWAVGKPADLTALPLLAGVEAVKAAKTADEVVALIDSARLPRECVPTQWLNDPAVWLALLPTMPPMALLRNLGKLASLGLFDGPAEGPAYDCLRRRFARESLVRARLHPLSILMGLRQFAEGHGDRGKLRWPVAPKVVALLNAAFHDAFEAVEPTGQRLLLAVDCSASMDGERIAGTALTAREAAGALTLVTSATEPSCQVVGFTAGRSTGLYCESGLVPLDISVHRRLDDVLRVMREVPFGGTDCALPMLYAAEQGLKVDAFVILTDNETWAGDVHPTQALADYRRQTGIAAKLAVLAMTSTGYSIADPADAGQMDMVGFDTATPTVLADFLRG